MKLGLALRVMGQASTREILRECAVAADEAGIDDLWVADHIAIPPDDAEGSGGRYLDPLSALAWLAGSTRAIGLGTGVLILPYRPPLPTAKAIATVQELSGGRLRLGVGIGWMEPEFRALGVERRRRGRIADETLEFLRRCFAADRVDANGQPFLFLPRPAPPPIFVGGAPPHAFARATRYGDGWMPMGSDPSKLAPHIAELRRRFDAAGRSSPEVVVLTRLQLDDPAGAAAQLAALREIGVTRVVHGSRYAEAREFRADVDALAGLRTALPGQATVHDHGLDV
jgi:probable F420-dependent oxidoreductase